MGEINFISAIVGAFVSIIVAFLLSKIKEWLVQIRFRLSTKKSGMIILGPFLESEKMSIGNICLDFIVLQHANFDKSSIRCSYVDIEYPLKEEFKRLKQKLINDIEERERNGEQRVPYNGLNYKLLEFDTSYREIIDGIEKEILKLKFAPTDYFTQLITDLNTDSRYRNQIARETNLKVNPVKEFASIVGINFNVITSDGYLIVTERSQYANVNAGIFHTSVAENMSRPIDAGSNTMAPDVFRCAVRGIKEELGLEVEETNIMFTTFGAYPKWCQYKLIGYTHIQENKEQVIRLHSTVEAKDKWENNKLHFVPCNPTSIAEFVATTIDRWYDIGLVCVVLSLFQKGYTHKEIEHAFIKAKVRR